MECRGLSVHAWLEVYWEMLYPVKSVKSLKPSSQLLNHVLIQVLTHVLIQVLNHVLIQVLRLVLISPESCCDSSTPFVKEMFT